jgi:aspartyl-tRNA(Asn)/glutamyl-tRNA(Gln) amidotransferase subunit C
MGKVVSKSDCHENTGNHCCCQIYGYLPPIVALDMMKSHIAYCRTMDSQGPSLAEELETTADLALLQLSEADRARLEAGVRTLLEHFAVMSSIDVSDLPATTHALADENRVRSDRERVVDATLQSPDPDSLLEQAPDLEDRFFAIPNVL